jgi:ferredoxin-NADP reductase
MLRHRQARSSDVPTSVLVSVRSPEDRLYARELEGLAGLPGMALALTYTRRTPAGWDGFARRVDAGMLAAVGPAPGERPLAFVCGPTPFVETVTALLVQAGHDPRLIHAERFGPTGGG